MSLSPRSQLACLAPLAVVLAACASATAPSPAARGTSPAPAHNTAPKLAAPLPRSYVALGASETYGVGANPFNRGYAYLVARQLAAAHFRDTGIPGATLGVAYDTELTQALAAKPALCTVFFGFNDVSQGVTRTDFLQNLHDLVATLRRAHSQILIIGLPDLSLLPAVRHRFPHLHQIVVSWNAGMHSIAGETGARFLDLNRFAHELASHPEYVSADGLHPSNAGHARLAQVVIAAVREDRLWPSQS